MSAFNSSSSNYRNKSLGSQKNLGIKYSVHSINNCFSAFCPICDVPFNSRIRLNPCYHVICGKCYDDVASQQTCYICNSFINDVEELFVADPLHLCPYEYCRRGFLNEKSFQYHKYFKHSLLNNNTHPGDPEVYAGKLPYASNEEIGNGPVPILQEPQDNIFYSNNRPVLHANKEKEKEKEKQKQKQIKAEAEAENESPHIGTNKKSEAQTKTESNNEIYTNTDTKSDANIITNTNTNTNTNTESNAGTYSPADSQSHSESNSDPNSDSNSGAGSSSDIDSYCDSDSDSDVNSDSDSDSDVNSDSDSDLESNSQSKYELELQSETVTVTETETETETDTEIGSESEMKSNLSQQGYKCHQYEKESKSSKSSMNEEAFNSDDEKSDSEPEKNIKQLQSEQNKNLIRGNGERGNIFINQEEQEKEEEEEEEKQQQQEKQNENEKNRIVSKYLDTETEYSNNINNFSSGNNNKINGRGGGIIDSNANVNVAKHLKKNDINTTSTSFNATGNSVADNNDDTNWDDDASYSLYVTNSLKNENAHGINNGINSHDKTLQVSTLWENYNKENLSSHVYYDKPILNLQNTIDKKRNTSINSPNEKTAVPSEKKHKVDNNFIQDMWGLKGRQHTLFEKTTAGTEKLKEQEEEPQKGQEQRQGQEKKEKEKEKEKNSYTKQFQKANQMISHEKDKENENKSIEMKITEDTTTNVCIENEDTKEKYAYLSENSNLSASFLPAGWSNKQAVLNSNYNTFNFANEERIISDQKEGKQNTKSDQEKQSETAKKNIKEKLVTEDFISKEPFNRNTHTSTIQNEKLSAMSPKKNVEDSAAQDDLDELDDLM